MPTGMPRADPDAGPSKPLEFALAPYIGTRPLLAMFQPLADYLEQRIGREVLLVTAPSLREFERRARNGEYEIAMMSPQRARPAQMTSGYVPLLRVTNDLYGVLVVPEASNVRSVRDLAQRRIALPDRLTVTARLGRELLNTAGVDERSIVYPRAFQSTRARSRTRSCSPCCAGKSMPW
ncbi:MAG: PhnD/SsuA/transferrin family substrate-binding protein [Betaproteobacteria bacterium]